MNFTFFGTDEFSIGVLETLKKGGLIPAVVITRTDRPTGRKQILTPPPLKVWALKHNVPVIQPEKLDSQFVSQISTYNCQLFIVASYGKIIPKNVLELPAYGTLNVHPSLLPKYRGPTPLQTMLLNGDKETGVTIMLMDEEMDHGAILASTKHEIRNSKNYIELGMELAKLGGKMLVEVIPKWITGEIKAVPQDHAQATYTRKFTSEDGFIKPEIILQGCTHSEHTATACPELSRGERQVRALNPEPGAWTTLERFDRSIAVRPLRIRVLSAKIEPAQVTAGILENTSLRLVPIRVIPSGKKEMSWEEFLRGHKNNIG